jgi:hypothetical protein
MKVLTISVLIPKSRAWTPVKGSKLLLCVALAFAGDRSHLDCIPPSDDFLSFCGVNHVDVALNIRPHSTEVENYCQQFVSLQCTQSILRI